jgi:hypothetical protein
MENLMARKITTEYKRESAELVIKHGYKHQDAADVMLDYL